MKHIRIAAVAFVISAGVTAATPGRAPSPDRGHMLVHSITAQPIFFCYSCISCATGKHDMRWLTPYDIYSDNHDCLAGHTCDDHEFCQGQNPEELGKLWAALQQYQGKDLHDVLAAYPQVSYNRDRKAFQIHLCGQLAGQLPALESQIRTLE